VAAAGQITGGGEKQAVGVLAIASCAADLLIVGLHGAGGGEVNHRPNVATVDAHAEGVGGHHDLKVAVLKLLLHPLPLLGAEARVVGGGVPARALEAEGLFFGGFAGGGIEDGGASVGAGGIEGLL